MKHSDRKPQVLSLAENFLGHTTYTRLMKKYFSSSKKCNLVSESYDHERTVLTKAVRRILVTARAPNTWAKKQNLDFYRLRSQLANSFMTGSRARRLLADGDYSVLHFHTQALSLLSPALMRRYPTVLTIDYTTYQAASEFTTQGLRWTHSPNVALEARAFRNSARIVSFSQNTRKAVIEHYNIAEDKVLVIHPGVDIDAIAPDFKTRTGNKKPRLLFIGGDFERKGGYEVLSAFNSLRSAADLDLVTNADIGEVPQGVQVHRNIKPYTKEWLELFRSADIFVLPTRLEAYGQVFCEAMAAGLPVVASNVDAIPELVADGRSGLLVKPKDVPSLTAALRELISDAGKRIAFGEAGRTIAIEKFDARKNFAMLDDLFYELAIERQASEK